eukprot:1725209-Rhodomonas_salina.4
MYVDRARGVDADNALGVWHVEATALGLSILLVPTTAGAAGVAASVAASAFAPSWLAAASAAVGIGTAAVMSATTAAAPTAA